MENFAEWKLRKQVQRQVGGIVGVAIALFAGWLLHPWTGFVLFGVVLFVVLCHTAWQAAKETEYFNTR